jgi:hypothetical protein
MRGLGHGGGDVVVEDGGDDVVGAQIGISDALGDGVGGGEHPCARGAYSVNAEAGR